MTLAITRALSPSIANCELTHLNRRPIDFERALRQHHSYEALLAELDCEVLSLPAEDAYPDSVFVEDAAVVVAELAVITRPGAASRRGECESIAAALEAHRSLAHIVAPGTLDGGDVLRVGQQLWVGLSTRSNEAGARQLRELLAPHGYTVDVLSVRDCLHLKTAVTQIAADAVLYDPRWIDPTPFTHLRSIATADGEEGAANALCLQRGLVYPASAFPLTTERLRAAGCTVHDVEADELAKAEGAVTCCSLILDGV